MAQTDSNHGARMAKSVTLMETGRVHNLPLVWKILQKWII